MYEEMILSTLDFIEEHIGDDLSLISISERFNISPSHFSRIFSFLVGESYRQYVKKRRINRSLLLLDRGHSVIDTALSSGFSHPESYTRAFRDVFGLSPKHYRGNNKAASPSGVGQIIARDLVNFKGDLLLKAEYVYLRKKILFGQSLCRNTESKGWLEELDSLGDVFSRWSGESDLTDKNVLYHFASCTKEGNIYEFRFCREALVDKKECPAHMNVFSLDEGWYAKFRYRGKLIENFTHFDSDIRKWISKKDENLKIVGKGVMIRYDQSNSEEFEIYIKLSRKLR